MAEQQAPPAGPDLTQGIALAELSGKTLVGHVGDDEILLVVTGSEIFAIDAHCSHYHGPLALPKSIWPAYFARNTAITLPMSFMPAAPLSVIAAEIAALTSSSDICLGR